MSVLLELTDDEAEDIAVALHLLDDDDPQPEQATRVAGLLERLRNAGVMQA